MNYIIFPIVLLITGCVGVPIKGKFPDVPDTLLVPPTELNVAIESERLSDFLQTVTDNYSICENNSEKLIAWQHWYSEQQKIYNEE
jgi:hypothetical protein